MDVRCVVPARRRGAAQALTEDLTSPVRDHALGARPQSNDQHVRFDRHRSRTPPAAPVLAPIDVAVAWPSGRRVTLANKTGDKADGRPYVSPMAPGPAARERKHAFVRAQVRESRARELQQHAAGPAHDRSSGERPEPHRRGGDRRNERASDRTRGRCAPNQDVSLQLIVGDRPAWRARSSAGRSAQAVSCQD